MSTAHSFYFHFSFCQSIATATRCVLYATPLSMISVCVFGRQTATSHTLHMINWLLAFAASDTVLCSCRLQIARNGHSRKFIVATARRGALYAVLCCVNEQSSHINIVSADTKQHNGEDDERWARRVEIHFGNHHVPWMTNCDNITFHATTKHK